MKNWMADRRVNTMTAVASLLVLWTILAIPGGPDGTGFVSAGVLAILLVAITRMVRPASPATLSEAEGAGIPVPVAGPLAGPARITLNKEMP